MASALYLARAGHQVQLIEQSPQFNEVGAGIQCGANANWVLADLGLLAALKPFAVEPKHIEFKDYQTGSCLHRIPLGQSYQQKYQQPYWNLHRADLLSVLVDAVREQPNIHCQLATKFERFEENPDGVVVYTDRGDFTTQLLIAADGIHSIVRAQLAPAERAQFTGNVAWRAVVPIERLSKNWMPTITANFVGPNKHAVIYYLRDKKLVNLVAVVENSQWRDSSWVAGAPRSELKTDFHGWHPTISKFIDAIESDQCYRWALLDHQPLDKWHTSRVAVLGDAAHACLPFMAAGASMALEDACVLGRALSLHNDLETGLAAYQRARFERTRQVQKRSRQAGQIYHFNSRLMRKAAFKGVGLMAKFTESFLPAYNATKISLS